MGPFPEEGYAAHAQYFTKGVKPNTCDLVRFPTAYSLYNLNDYKRCVCESWMIEEENCILGDQEPRPKTKAAADEKLDAQTDEPQKDDKKADDQKQTPVKDAKEAKDKQSEQSEQPADEKQSDDKKADIKEAADKKAEEKQADDKKQDQPAIEDKPSTKQEETAAA